MISKFVHPIIQFSLAFLAITFPSPTSGLFFRRCPGSERCGFLRIFIVMRDGEPGTDQCVERCLFFKDDSLECGGCSSSTEVVPTQAPAPAPAPAPIAIPTPVQQPIGVTPTQTPIVPPIEFIPIPVNSSYDISFQLIDVPVTDQEFFAKAAQRWESIIVGDLSNISKSLIDNSGLSTGCTLPDVIDDLYICAKYEPIDNKGNVVGLAGPLYVRSNNLTITGTMRFDSADIDTLRSAGQIGTTILHEMGHVLGMLLLSVLSERKSCHFVRR
jgi:hypothetical protein